MFKAILDQRASPREGFWIDQICINQDDNGETQFGIAAMDVVYKFSRLVVIVLKDICLSADEVSIVDLVEDDIYWEAPEGMLVSVGTCLHKIFGACRFSRAWCLHELQLTEQPRFLVPTVNGVISVGTEALEALFTQLSRLEEIDSYWAKASHRIDSQYSILNHVTDTNNRLPPTPGYALQIMSRVHDVFMTQSFIAGDKLSISMKSWALLLLLHLAEIYRGV